jgi:hypothetical protein
MMSDDDDELDGKVDEKTINADEIIKTKAKGTWGGKRPGTGGRRPGSGRKKGTPNKVTAEIKQLAQQYGPEAIAELARLATKAESEAARVAAIKELLDRGYGRAVQPIEGSMTYIWCERATGRACVARTSTARLAAR